MIKVCNLKKDFGKLQVLKGIDVHVFNNPTNQRTKEFLAKIL